MAIKKVHSKSKIIKRKPVKKRSSFLKWFLRITFAIIFTLLAIFVWQYKDGVLFYLGFKTNKTLSPIDRKLADVHIYEVFGKHKENALGFDVSEYQGDIEWENITKLNGEHQLHFVFIRATAGKDKVDTKFVKNFKNAKKVNFIRGAYHYYRPNENSLEQAANFIKTVQLQKGDLPPVLDIEQLPKNQSIANLKKGLKKWLDAVEKHYKVKPIIYSGESYYKDFLKEEFSDYTFWIANYNFWEKKIDDEWHFWQFSEKATIPGIKGPVDVNVYQSNPYDMVDKLTKK